MRTWTTIAACALLCSSIPHGWAWDIDAEVKASAEYDSNVDESNANERSGWNYQPGLSVNISETADSLNASFSYDTRKRYYESGRYDNDTHVTGRGAINWGVVNDVWNVYGENQRVLTTINNRQANTPDNQQTIDTSTVGSNVFIPVGRHRLVLQVEETHTGQDELDNDSEGSAITAAYRVPFGDTHLISLVHSELDVEFDNPSSSEYQNNTTSIFYHSVSRVLEINLDVGQTRIEFDDSSTEIEGTTGQIDLLRRLGDNSEIQFNASRRITDGLNQRRGFFFDNIGQPDLSEEFTAGNQVFELTQYALRGSTVFGANHLSMLIGHSTRDYEFTDTDELRHSVSATLNRKLGRDNRFSLGLRYVMSSFDDAPHDEYYSGRMSYDHQFTRRFGMSISASYSTQESDAVVRDYDGWTSMITFRYQIFEGNDPGRLSGRIHNFGSRQYSSF